MKRVITVLTALFLATLTGFLSCFSVGANEFLKKAPAGWEKYKQKLRRLQGKYSLFVQVNERPKSLVMRGEFRQCPTGSWFIERRPSQDDSGILSGECSGINSKYGFSLFQKYDNAPWLLRRIERGAEKATAASDLSILYLLNLPLDLLKHDYLPSLATDNRLVWGKETVTKEGEKQCLRVDFEDRRPPTLEGPDQRKKAVHINRGTMLIDSMGFWLLRSFDLEVSLDAGDIWNDGRIKGDFEYDTSNADSAILKRFVRTKTFKALGENKELVTKKDIYEFSLDEGNFLESEFTLSAFGLPEPSWPAPGYPTSNTAGGTPPRDNF
ncbi:MAG: hypothetical protein HY040_05775 [Planctomycetes bacterium]|nr:hypothetical protein [Planctomycetota bacterium]